MSARPLAAGEAAELSEILELTADALGDNGAWVLDSAGMERTELRSTLLSWAMRLLDIPVDEGSS